MRYLGFVALAALTACGGEAQNETKAAAVDALRPGQYEVVAESTQFRQADEGEAVFNMAVGTRETRMVCVGETAPPDLFAPEGLTCQPGSSTWMRGGSISSTYVCTTPGRGGEVMLTIDGSFTADGFEVTRSVNTRLEGQGDIVAQFRMAGRRTGDCAPAAAGGNEAAPANSN